MKLTLRLVLWFLLCAVVAVGASGYVAVQLELQRFETDLGERHAVMGRVLRAAFTEVLDSESEAKALTMLAYTDKSIRQVDIRCVSLDQNAPADRRPRAPREALTALLSDQEVHFKDVPGGRLDTYVPLRLEGQPLAALEFSEALDGERGVVRVGLFRGLRSVTAIAIALGGAAAVLGALLIGRPVRRLVQHARRVGRGDFSLAPLAKRGDELFELASEMNAMCTQLEEAQGARLKALEQLRHAERLTTVGKLASGLAHELGTPLNVIILRAKAIAQGRADGERAKENAHSIAEQATRMTELVRQLLGFARRRPPQRNTIRLDDVVAKSVSLLAPMAEKANARLETHGDPDSLSITGDPTQLQQVLANLIVNAIQSMPNGGLVRIGTDSFGAAPPAGHDGPEGEYARLRVRDEGTGIQPEALPHVFEPFFTTKDVGEGTGLGLSVCYGIVRDHGGWIEVRTEVGGGTEFSVFLPKETA